MDGVLGRAVAIIVGLIALAGVALAGMELFYNHRASTVVSDITTTVTNARGLFAQNNNGYTNFTTSNESALASAGVFPSDMNRSGTIYDAWGNTVTLSSADSDTEGVISFGGGGSETVKQCTSVVTNLKDYVSLAVGSSTFTSTSQPDAVTAEEACDSDLTITLTFQ